MISFKTEVRKDILKIFYYLFVAKISDRAFVSMMNFLNWLEIASLNV